MWASSVPLLESMILLLWGDFDFGKIIPNRNKSSWLFDG